MKEVSTPFALKFRPHHFGVSVRKLQEAITWYHEILGFELELEFEVKTVPFRAAFIRRGDFRIELFEVEGAEALPEARRLPDEDLKTHGNKHMAFQVDDIQLVFDQFRQQGVDIAWDVFQIGDSFGGFIRDNTGNLIEFVEIGD